MFEFFKTTFGFNKQEVSHAFTFVFLNLKSVKHTHTHTHTHLPTYGPPPPPEYITEHINITTIYNEY